MEGQLKISREKWRALLVLGALWRVPREAFGAICS